MIYPFAFKQAFDGVAEHISGIETDKDLLFQPLLKAIVPGIDAQKAQALIASAPNFPNYHWAEFEDFCQPSKRHPKEQALAKEIISLIVSHTKLYSLRADVAEDPKLYKKLEVMLMDDVEAGHQYLKQYKLKDGQTIKATDKRFQEFEPPMTPVFSVNFAMAG